jgi:hypothetical protein
MATLDFQTIVSIGITIMLFSVFVGFVAAHIFARGQKINVLNVVEYSLVCGLLIICLILLKLMGS